MSDKEEFHVTQVNFKLYNCNNKHKDYGKAVIVKDSVDVREYLNTGHYSRNNPQEKPSKAKAKSKD